MAFIKYFLCLMMEQLVRCLDNSQVLIMEEMSMV